MKGAVNRRQMLAVSAAAGVAVAAADARGARDEGRIAVQPPGGRTRMSLDRGWRFVQRDIAMPVPLDHEASYANAKAGNAGGPASTDYDDADWSRVDLPHDFALTQPYDPAANLDQGYRRRGIGWYRRTFVLAADDRGRHFELEFGGAATVATVWLNGTLVHRHFTGFTGFTIDASPFLSFGDDPNTLVVRVDATASEGWWYEGAGLYRHAWLTRRHPFHIVTDGIHCDPVRAADGRWTVPVAATVADTGRAARTGTVEAQLIAPDGQLVATARVAVSVDPLGHADAHLTLGAPEPRRWSPDEPTLYTVRALLRLEGEVVDAVDTSIGFRTIRFDPAEGFFLNDRPLKIQGMCAHQDHAGVGVAVPDSLWAFRVERLKAMGANALRCAHNAPAAELLDACDRLGLMVMDENRQFNASEDYLPQLEWMVRRDRNHPSVILWSLFNEESLQSSPVGVAMARRMMAAVKTLDRSRPVTAALNGGLFSTINVAQELDVVGLNYNAGDYDRYHADHPDRPLISSEDTSTYMTRGVYTTDLDRHVLAADDEEHPDFGLSNRAAWRMIAERAFMAGGFAWTGFDYRGEPSPFQWPTASSLFGAMDLCGFAKTGFHIRRALWIKTAPVLEIVPHWTWPGREGQPIKVMAATNGDRVVFLLNGRPVGDMAVDPYAMATCRIAYAPGRLIATAYREGRAIAQAVVDTTGSPVALHLEPDRRIIDGDGRDAVPITVSMRDAHGRPIPIASDDVRFAVDGGRILGLGNGDPNSHEPDVPVGDARRRLFNGLAQVIVQADGRGSYLTLSAHADGVRSAVARISIHRVPNAPVVPAIDALQSLTEWRQSAATASRPDPNEVLADSDMNSWGWTKPGSTEAAVGGGRYTRFRVTFRPRASVRQRGGMVRFGRLSGRAEIWLDGRLVAEKTDPAPGALSVPLPRGDRDHMITVLFDAGSMSDPPFGIAAAVTVAPAA